MMKRILFTSLVALFAAGCAPGTASDPDEEDMSPEEVDVAQDALSQVAGCHFYVGSNYGGSTLWMARNTTIPDLHAYSMGDKISAVRVVGGASTRMWIDKNYKGKSWLISSNVTTLHTSAWGNLGDNASSADCY